MFYHLKNNCFAWINFSRYVFPEKLPKLQHTYQSFSTNRFYDTVLLTIDLFCIFIYSFTIIWIIKLLSVKNKNHLTDYFSFIFPEHLVTINTDNILSKYPQNNVFLSCFHNYVIKTNSRYIIRRYLRMTSNKFGVLRLHVMMFHIRK